MRILQFISSPAAGGAEIYVRDLSKSLKEKGHEVVVGFLESAAEVGRSESFEAEFLRQLQSAEIPYFFVGANARRKPWKGVNTVRQYAKAYAIDVYHSHLPYGAFFGAALSLPRVYTHHSVEPRLSPLLYGVMNRVVDQYIGISTICSERLSSFTGRGVATIFNGVEGSRLACARRLRRNHGHLVGLMVGRIRPQKNYFEAVDAVSEIHEDVRGRLVINVAGEGPAEYVRSLEQYIKERNVEDCFRLLGNRGDIPDLMRDSDFFLMSSAWEGLPIALIEAAMAGLPCIVTDVGGCREIVEACGNGMVIGSGDPLGLSAAIKLLITDAALLEKYSEAALERSKFLNIAAATDAHVSVYDQLAKRGR